MNKIYLILIYLSLAICVLPHGYSIDELNRYFQYRSTYENGLPDESIIDMRLMLNGNIAVGTSGGLGRITDSGYESVLDQNLPDGGNPAIEIFTENNESVFVISGVKIVGDLDSDGVDDPAGTGISWSLDSGETWNFIDQPTDIPLSLADCENLSCAEPLNPENCECYPALTGCSWNNNTEVCSPGANILFEWNDTNLFSLAQSTKVKNVTYDLSVDLELGYVYAASWAGMLRRFNYTEDNPSWELVPLPLDNQTEVECGSYPSDYIYNPVDPIISGNLNSGGNHNHKGFSVYSDFYNNTNYIWAGTADGVNKGVVDESGCINWTHYNTSNGLSGDWIIDIVPQDIGNDIPRIWLISWNRVGGPSPHGLTYTDDNGETWNQIKTRLASFARRVVVREINSESDDLLDYERYNAGMKVIAIGGNRLSRGLTLEGLTVSYYTRESKMYDTLLQMCRWFGFRPGYGDLMRIHMNSTLKENFGWLAYVEDAIRRDIAQYELQNKSPMDLAVRILTHAVLIPTAKLKPGSFVVTRTGWNSTPVETVYLNFNSPEILQSNLNLVGRFVYELEEKNRSKKEHSLWRNVPHEPIVNFIKKYQSTGLDAFDNRSLCKYINNQVERYEELTNWSVYIAQSGQAKRKLNLGPVEIGLPQRSRQRGKTKIGRLPNPFHFSIDLPGWKDAYKDDITGKHDFGKMLRARSKENGLLIIYILDKNSERWRKNEHMGIGNPHMPLFDNDEQAVDLVALSVVFPSSETAENESYMHVRGIEPIE